MDNLLSMKRCNYCENKRIKGYSVCEYHRKYQNEYKKQSRDNEITHVYFIKDGAENIKIGYSKNIISRIQTIANGNPNVSLLISYKVKAGIARGVEKHLHTFFLKYKIRREWFNFNHIPKIKSIDTVFDNIDEFIAYFSDIGLEILQEAKIHFSVLEQKYSREKELEEIEKELKLLNSKRDTLLSEIMEKEQVDRYIQGQRKFAYQQAEHVRMIKKDIKQSRKNIRHLEKIMTTNRVEFIDENKEDGIICVYDE